MMTLGDKQPRYNTNIFAHHSVMNGPERDPLSLVRNLMQEYCAVLRDIQNGSIDADSLSRLTQCNRHDIWDESKQRNNPNITIDKLYNILNKLQKQLGSYCASTVNDSNASAVEVVADAL